MNRKQTVLTVIVVIAALIQFIRPYRNMDNRILTTDITNIYTVPHELGAIFRNSCFDCHSNYTHYPWYTNIQPMGWWMASHIRDGKSELNFNEFGSYSPRKQLSKLKAIENSIEDEFMPLPSYVLIHRDAKLTKEEKEKITAWIGSVQDSLSRR